ncbi:MAG: glycosyltransferase family 25 protein [Bacteroidetes bacterium]|nr:glycosyltransferase family 25 protein [Bacteroidota bacterium]
MRVYVINMERSKSRRIAIKRQLNRLGLDYEIISAVDGRQMSDEELNEKILQQGEFTKSQAGCMLSHCKVYEAMQKHNDAYALVLEDDVLILENRLKEVLDKLQPQLSKDNITLLTYYWCRENSMLLNRKQGQQSIQGAKEKYFLCSPDEIHGVGRAAAYILSKETAQKILDFHSPKLICQADSWIVYYKEQVIKGVDCVYPMPISENPQFGSEIGYTRNKAEAIGKKLVEVAVNMNLPLISTLIKKKRINFAQTYKNIKLAD